MSDAMFRQKAPAIMADLMRDFPPLDPLGAAAILGNIGHECDGFRHLQEIHPVAGRGGLGWCQWTGPRRRAFEAWCSVCRRHRMRPITAFCARS
jgi:hypothetical protein